MNEEAAKARMAPVHAAIRASDEARLNALCDPDIVVEQAAALPYGGVYTGVPGLLAMLKGLRATLADMRVSTERVLSDATGDHILVLQGLRARSARTGRPVEMSVAELFSFRDGRLVSIRPHYFDAKAVHDACKEA
jgi:ketosteroid isomerase-like protein